MGNNEMNKQRVLWWYVLSKAMTVLKSWIVVEKVHLGYEEEAFRECLCEDCCLEDNIITCPIAVITDPTKAT